jgi:opacity protein-like surface antigen
MVAPRGGRGIAAALAGACVAGGLTAGLTPAVAGEPTYNWSGVYVGAHMGGAIDYSEFSNPYGPTLFGDTVRSPGPFGGLQIGTNYQSGLAVFGLQADVSGANMQGTFTCMQPERSVPGPPPAANFIGGAFGATCQSQPDWFGTLTGRAGVALGPQGRILLYGKGGLAWMHNSIDMAVNNIMAGDFGPENERSKTNFTQIGWTLALAAKWRSPAAGRSGSSTTTCTSAVTTSPRLRRDRSPVRACPASSARRPQMDERRA